MKKLALFALAALIAAPALFAQMSSVPTESMGSHLKTPEEKALQEYARGVKDRQRADKEQDHDKKMKLYTRAKDEFSKSVGYTAHYDGYLALGQVYLALGQRESAFDACSHAQAMKPRSEEAGNCMAEARKKPESSEAKPAGGG
jgi:cytochrome c-type biogenesis protein CcmH/NrfG